MLHPLLAFSRSVEGCVLRESSRRSWNSQAEDPEIAPLVVAVTYRYCCNIKMNDITENVTHTHTHARTHAHTHTHARTHTHIHTQKQKAKQSVSLPLNGHTIRRSRNARALSGPLSQCNATSWSPG